ncbi:MAG: MmcQ/YjbR family DNA-binding protein [Saprospiraceae bacterium]|nr:MmcQ/YjbR family DNA-binding protein [Saprospiraceae bacterium]
MNHINELRAYCLSKPGAWEDLPFDDVTLTMKVGKKIFAIIATDSEPLQISLKCKPMWAISLRQDFEDINPGYHLNKKHWNTVTLTGSVDDEIIKNMIDHSWELVFESLTGAEKGRVKR